MISRAPANASPRCGADAATTTDGSLSGDVADAVLDRRGAQPVPLDRGLGDRPQRLERHLLVGLVVERGHLARDALERHDRTRARVAHARDRVDRQRLGADRDVHGAARRPTPAGSARARRPAPARTASSAYSRLTAMTTGSPAGDVARARRCASRDPRARRAARARARVRPGALAELGEEADGDLHGGRNRRMRRRTTLAAHGDRAQGHRGAPHRRADRRPGRPAALHRLRHRDQARCTPTDDVPGDLEERLGEPGDYPYTRGAAPRDVPQADVDDAPVRGLRVGEGVQRALPLPALARAAPACRWPSTCRPSSAWTPTTRAASARSAAPASRSTRSTTCARRSTGSRSTRSRRR